MLQILCIFLKNTLKIITYQNIYVTQHEKIGLMCTIYTSLNYFTYFTFCVSYRSSVNCIKFSLVCSTSFESFIDKLNFGCKVVQPQKSGQSLCAHKPDLLMLGHIYRISCMI